MEGRVRTTPEELDHRGRRAPYPEEGIRKGLNYLKNQGLGSGGGCNWGNETGYMDNGTSVWTSVRTAQLPHTLDNSY